MRSVPASSLISSSSKPLPRDGRQDAGMQIVSWLYFCMQKHPGSRSAGSCFVATLDFFFGRG